MNEKIETIKKKSIKEIIEKETNLTFKGSGIKYQLSECPFCHSGTGKNKTSAFHIRTDKNIFHCFTCNQKGGAIEFIKALKNFDNKEAISYLFEKYKDISNFETTETNETEKQNKIEKKLYRIKQNGITEAKNYLLSRSIDVELLPQNSYFYNPPYKSKGVENGACIVFVDSTETMINRRFIDSKEFRFDGSYKNKVYDKLFKPEVETIWLHEGVINALSMPENSCISLFTAVNLIDKPEVLKPYIEDKIVILCGDNDQNESKAGQRFNDYYKTFIQKNIRTKEIRICKLPPDTDHNDLKKQGRLIDFNSNESNFEVVKEDTTKKYSGVVYNDNGIFLENKKGEIYNVADFHIYLKYCLYDKMNDTTDWVIELKRFGEPELFLRITNDEWNSAKELRKAINKKQYLFKGTDNDLIKIKSYLGRIKNAEIINVLGHHEESDGYFYSNEVQYKGKIVVPNQHNIVELNGSSYFMPYTDLTKKVIDNAARFINVKSNVDFKTWYNLFYQMWDNGKQQHAVLPTMYYIASLYLDFIFGKKSCFPIYYAHGISNSGKSSLARSLTCLSGYKQKDVNLKQVNTIKSLPRIAAQISNAITWFDEYHVDLPSDVKGICQSFFDRAGYNRAEMDSLSTNSINPQSALILTANTVEKEDYFLTRYIYHPINEKTHKDTQIKAKNELKFLEEKGLSSVTNELLSYRNLVISNWENDSKYVYNQLLKKCNDRNIHSRLYDNMTLCLTPAYTLIKNNKINLLKSIDEILEIGKKHILSLYKLLKQTDGIDDFWTVIQLGTEDGKIIKGIDFKIKDTLIFIRFERLYMYYKSKMGFKPIEKDVIKQKLLSSEYYKDYTTKTRFGQTPTSAHILDYEKLKEEHNINF